MARRISSATMLVKGGTLVTSEGTLEADLLAQGERIKAVGRDLPMANDTLVLDAAGCYVLPGVIDAHTVSIGRPTIGSSARAQRPAAV
jgi:dihydroorotase-like cyclic amidohydrolase